MALVMQGGVGFKSEFCKRLHYYTDIFSLLNLFFYIAAFGVIGYSAYFSLNKILGRCYE